MIRGIIFDCFGVLYHGSIGHLHELTPKDKRAELANLSLSSDYGYLSRTSFVAQVGELIGRSAVDIESIMHSDHIRNSDLVEFVKTLRPHYKVAMLSNVGRGVIDKLFTQEELAEFFDVVVLSSEVGIVKPDPAIFNLTSEKLGLLPEDCLMVDDLESNIDGAMSTGMQGVVFTTTNESLSAITMRMAK